MALGQMIRILPWKKIIEAMVIGGTFGVGLSLYLSDKKSSDVINPEMNEKCTEEEYLGDKILTKTDGKVCDKELNTTDSTIKDKCSVNPYMNVKKHKTVTRKIERWIKRHKKEIGITMMVVGVACLCLHLGCNVYQHSLKTKASILPGITANPHNIDVIKNEEPIISSFCNNGGALEKRLVPIDNTEAKTIFEKVGMYVRRLPEGHCASEAKINEAKELGILLPERYTLVDAYERSRKIMKAA